MALIQGLVNSKYCTICSSLLGSENSSEDSCNAKIVQTFLDCMNIDQESLNLQTSLSFCLKCKLSLEEWEYSQNQVVRFLTRSRELKASLIATILESKDPLMITTYSRRPDEKVGIKLVRQLIRQSFTPRVVLKKADQNDLRSAGVKITSTVGPVITEISPGHFLYQGKVPFTRSACEYRCGLCSFSCSDWQYGRSKISFHINCAHLGVRKMLESSKRVGNQAQQSAFTIECFNEVENLKPSRGPEIAGATASASRIPGVPTAENDVETDTLDVLKIEIESFPSEDNAEEFQMDQDPLQADEDSKTDNDQINPNNVLALHYASDSDSTASDSVSSHFAPTSGTLRATSNVNSNFLNAITFTNGATMLSLANGSTGSSSVSIPSPSRTATAPTKLKPCSEPPPLIHIKEKLYKVGDYLVQEVEGGYKCLTCKKVFVGGAQTQARIRKHIRHTHLGNKTSDSWFQGDTTYIKKIREGEYLYRGSVTFYYEGGTFVCGRCGERVTGKNPVWGKERIMRHMKTVHITHNIIESAAGGSVSDYHYRGVRVTVVNGKHICQLCSRFFDGKDTQRKAIQHIERVHRPLPVEFNYQKRSAMKFVRKVGEGEFLYRNRIPFSHKDDNLICGLCSKVVSLHLPDAPSQMITHIKTFHADVLPWPSKEPIESSAKKSSTGSDELTDHKDSTGPHTSTSTGSPVPVAARRTVADLKGGKNEGQIADKLLNSWLDYRQGKFHCRNCSHVTEGDYLVAKKAMLEHHNKTHQVPNILRKRTPKPATDFVYKGVHSSVTSAIYKCGVCDEQFGGTARREKLKDHIDRHHGDNHFDPHAAAARLQILTVNQPGLLIPLSNGLTSSSSSSNGMVSWVLPPQVYNGITTTATTFEPEEPCATDPLASPKYSGDVDPLSHSEDSGDVDPLDNLKIDIDPPEIDYEEASDPLGT